MKKLFGFILMLLLSAMVITSCGSDGGSNYEDSGLTTDSDSPTDSNSPADSDFCPTGFQGTGTMPACVSVVSVSPDPGSHLDFDSQEKIEVKLSYKYSGVDAVIKFGWTKENSLNDWGNISSCDPPAATEIYLDPVVDGKYGRKPLEWELKCIRPTDESDVPYRLVFWIMTAEESLLDKSIEDMNWGANYTTLTFN